MYIYVTKHSFHFIFFVFINTFFCSSVISSESKDVDTNVVNTPSVLTVTVEQPMIAESTSRVTSKEYSEEELRKLIQEECEKQLQKNSNLPTPKIQTPLSLTPSISSKPQRNLKILSIDGGGIRGIIPLYLLARLEEITGKRTCEMFDVIAGTSTGGMIALGLSLKSAKEILDLYVHKSDEIFVRNHKVDGPKYKSKPMKKTFSNYFGDLKLSDAKIPTLVTAFEFERNQPFELCSKWPESAKFQQGKLDMYMYEAALATSAAPTYFEPVIVHPLTVDGGRSETKYSFIDGGVFANNPSMKALSYGLALNPDLTTKNIKLLSLGTGKKDNTSYSTEDAKHWTRLGWLPAILHILLNAQNESADKDLYLVLGKNYDRISTTLHHADAKMDKLGSNIERLLFDAEDMFKKNEHIIQKWLSILNSDTPRLISREQKYTGLKFSSTPNFYDRI